MLRALERIGFPGTAAVSRDSILGAILVFSVLSTAIHYTHNFIEVDQYPQSSLVSTEAVQIVIVALWPLLTAIGLWGYRQYVRGRYRLARAALFAYSFTGLATLGHFVDGNPDIPAFFYATIFTDFVAGAAVLGFVVWSVRSQEPTRVPATP